MTPIPRARSTGDVMSAIYACAAEMLPLANPEITRATNKTAYEGANANKARSEEHTSELQSHHDLVCRLLLEKKKKKTKKNNIKQNKKKQKKYKINQK